MDLSTPDHGLFNPADELDDADTAETAPATDLDAIVAEITSPPRKRAPLVEEIPNRPGWSLVLKVDQTDTDRKLAAGKAKKMGEAMDAKNTEAFIVELGNTSAFLIGLACIEMRRGDLVVTDEMIGGKTSNPVTFNLPAFMAMLNVKTMSDCVIKFLGVEAVMDIAEKLEAARKQWLLEESDNPRS